MTKVYYDPDNWPKYDLNEYGQGLWEFDPERDFKVSNAWIYIPLWSGLSPFGLWETTLGGLNHFSYGANYASYPRCRGNACRTLRGGLYMTELVLEDEEEIKQREARFREVMSPYIDDFMKVYREQCQALARLQDPLKDLIRQGLGKLRDDELYTYFDEWLYLHAETWRRHYIILHPMAVILTLFVDMCQELLDIDETSPLFLRLMQGFHNEFLESDAEMERLAALATDLGLKDLFLDPPKASELVPKLEESIDGRKWLKKFQAFIDHAGWRVPKASEFTEPTWIEDPTGALLAIHNYVIGERKDTLTSARQSAEQDRKKAEEEALSKVPEARREEFMALLRSAQACNVIASEHEFYFDMMVWAIGRHLGMEFGSRATNYGMINKPGDIFYITGWELSYYFLSRQNFKELVSRRKKLQKLYQSEQPRLPILGGAPPEEAFGRAFKAGDYQVMKVVVGTIPKVKPELKADIYGVPASRGVAEGIARVVIQPEELKEIRKGEILVCAASFPSWTWAFSLIGAAVADSGGIASHTAIVSREYRIPAVINAHTATTTIKTGQRIRVDGNEGAVYILD